MTVTGPSFIALQVRDLERSAQFYETYLGLRRAPQAPPNAVVFATEPIPFAVREPLPGVNLDEISRPGLGVALWMHGSGVRSLLTKLKEADVRILQEPTPGPFGESIIFADPDGYAVTVHDQV